MAIYFGIGNGLREVKEIYFGVTGTPRKVKEGYIGIGGTPRRFYSAAADPWALAAREVGSLVYLKENGVKVPYIVSAHQYSLGNTLPAVIRSVLVRQEAFTTCYNSTTQFTSAQTSYEGALEQAVIAAATVKPAFGSSYVSSMLYLGMLGLTLSGFSLSAYQTLPNAAALKLCDQWLADKPLSTVSSSTKAYTNASGTAASTAYSTTTHGYRPALFMPGETRFDPETNEFAGG